MASSIPSQARAIDPFASYNSDTVNTLTRMLTYGENGIATALSCNVIRDLPSETQVILEPGFLYQQDVWMHITANHTVDFTDPDHYYNFDTGFDEAGWYYIVLDYTFVKSRPAPQAKALIVKPSQRGAYIEGNSWLFLAAVEVEWDGSNFVIVSLSNYDPENTDNQRIYVSTYAGTEVGLPTHLPLRDTSRIVYGIEEDDFFFGFTDRWISLEAAAAVTYQANTTGFEKGDLVYTTYAGNISKAISTLELTTADGVVSRVGDAVTGLIQTVGYVANVKIETASPIIKGQLCYLSESEPGTVTDQKPSPVSQYVGRCVNIDSTTVNILFHRGEPLRAGGSSLGTYIAQTSLPSGGSWILESGSYYQDVDISDFDEKNVAVTVWDNATEYMIVPENIEFTSITNMRIWMPVPTKTLNVFAIGPTSSTIPTSDVEVVTDTLSSGSWLGAGPYYQDVDVTTLTGQSSVVMVRDTSTNEQIMPAEIHYDTANSLRIWMPVNTQELDIVAIGPSATPTSRIAFTTVLPSGASWVASGGLYYQDVYINDFAGNDVVVQYYDIDSDEVIYPAAIEFTSLTNIRVWMSDDTRQLNVTIIG